MQITHNGSIAERMLSGGKAAATGRILVAVLGLGTNALLAKMMSPLEVGGYFLAFSLMNILAVFSQLGLHQAIMRLIPEAYAKAEDMRVGALVVWFNVTVTCFAMCLAIGLVVFGETIIDKFFGSSVLASSFVFISLWFVLGASKLIVSNCFRSFHQIPLATAFNGIVSSTLIVSTLATIYWFRLNFKLNDALAIACIGNAFAYVAGLSILLRRVHGARIQELGNLWKYFSIAFPMWLSTSSMIILIQIDVWIISKHLFEEAVALYGMALKLANFVSMPFFIVVAVVPPLISELHFSNNHERLRSMIRSAATLASIPSLFALIIFLFWGDKILQPLFGEFYIDAHVILQILVFGHFAKVVFGASPSALSMTGHQRFIMANTLFFGACKITMGIAAIKIWGIVGFAVVASTTMALQALVEMFVYKAKSGIWTCASLDFGNVIRFLRRQETV